MDAFTGFTITALLVLITGGMLALMTRDLPADMRPSASDWRSGALVFALGTALVAALKVAPASVVAPIANGCLMLGYTLFWRAARRFSGVVDSNWIFTPTVVTAIGIWFFTVVMSSFNIRVVIFAAMAGFVSFSAAWVLMRHRPAHAVMTHFVLAGFFALNGVTMAVRCLYQAIQQPAGGSLLDPQNNVTTYTALIGSFLPILGSTAFLLLCAERIRRRWEYAASTDELTGLVNRRTILGMGELQFAEACNANKAFSVAVVDIDHFKSVNDRFGHEAGDHALKHVSALLDANCRGPNKVGRLGGEEFVVLLPSANAVDAAAVAERLRFALESTPLAQSSAVPEPLRITASIGVASQTGADHDLSELLGRADRALYAAKHGGRNRVAVGMHEQLK